MQLSFSVQLPTSDINDLESSEYQPRFNFGVFKEGVSVNQSQDSLMKSMTKKGSLNMNSSMTNRFGELQRQMLHLQNEIETTRLWASYLKPEEMITSEPEKQKLGSLAMVLENEILKFKNFDVLKEQVEDPMKELENLKRLNRALEGELVLKTSQIEVFKLKEEQERRLITQQSAMESDMIALKARLNSTLKILAAQPDKPIPEQNPPALPPNSPYYQIKYEEALVESKKFNIKVKNLERKLEDEIAFSKSLQEQLSGASSLRKIIDDLNAQISEMSHKSQENEHKVEKLNKKLAKINDHNSSMKKASEKNSTTRKHLQSHITYLEQTLQKAQEKNQTLIDKLEERGHALSGDESYMNETIEELHHQIDFLSEEKEQILKENEILREKLNSFDPDAEEFGKVNVELREEIQILKEEYARKSFAFKVLEQQIFDQNKEIILLKKETNENQIKIEDLEEKYKAALQKNSFLNSREKNLLETIRKLEEREKNLSEKVDKLQKMEADGELKLRKLEKEIEKLKKGLNDKIDELENEKEISIELKDEISELQNEVLRLKQFAKTPKIVSLRNNLIPAEENENTIPFEYIEELSMTAEDFRSRIMKLNEIIKQKDNKNNELNDEIDNLKKKLLKKKEKIKEQKDKKKKLKEKIRDLEDLLNEAQKHNAKKEELISNLVTENEKLKERIDELRKQLKNEESKTWNLENEKQEILIEKARLENDDNRDKKNNDAEKTEYKKQLDSLKEEKEDAQKKAKEAEQKHEKVEFEKSLQDQDFQVEKHKNDLLKNRIEDISDDLVKAKKDLFNERMKNQEIIYELKSENEELKAKNEVLENDIQELNEKPAEQPKEIPVQRIFEQPNDYQKKKDDLKKKKIEILEKELHDNQKTIVNLMQQNTGDIPESIVLKIENLEKEASKVSSLESQLKVSKAQTEALKRQLAKTSSKLEKYESQPLVAMTDEMQTQLVQYPQILAQKNDLEEMNKALKEGSAKAYQDIDNLQKQLIKEKENRIKAEVTYVDPDEKRQNDLKLLQNKIDALNVQNKMLENERDEIQFAMEQNAMKNYRAIQSLREETQKEKEKMKEKIAKKKEKSTIYKQEIKDLKEFKDSNQSQISEQKKEEIITKNLSKSPEKVEIKENGDFDKLKSELNSLKELLYKKPDSHRNIFEDLKTHQSELICTQEKNKKLENLVEGLKNEIKDRDEKIEKLINEQSVYNFDKLDNDKIDIVNELELLKATKEEITHTVEVPAEAFLKNKPVAVHAAPVNSFNPELEDLKSELGLQSEKLKQKEEKIEEQNEEIEKLTSKLLALKTPETWEANLAEVQSELRAKEKQVKYFQEEDFKNKYSQKVQEVSHLISESNNLREQVNHLLREKELSQNPIDPSQLIDLENKNRDLQMQIDVLEDELEKLKIKSESEITKLNDEVFDLKLKQEKNKTVFESEVGILNHENGCLLKKIEEMSQKIKEAQTVKPDDNSSTSTDDEDSILKKTSAKEDELGKKNEKLKDLIEKSSNIEIELRKAKIDLQINAETLQRNEANIARLVKRNKKLENAKNNENSTEGGSIDLNFINKSEEKKNRTNDNEINLEKELAHEKDKILEKNNEIFKLQEKLSLTEKMSEIPKEELKNANAKISHLSETQNSLKKDKSDVNSKLYNALIENSELKQKLESNNRKNEALTEEVKKLSEKNDKLNSKKQKLKQKSKELAGEVIKQEKEISSANKMNQNFVEQLKRFEIFKTKIENLRKSNDELYSQLHEAKISLQDHSAKEKSLKKEVKTIEKARKLFEKKNNALKQEKFKLEEENLQDKEQLTRMGFKLERAEKQQSDLKEGLEKSQKQEKEAQLLLMDTYSEIDSLKLAVEVSKKNRSQQGNSEEPLSLAPKFEINIFGDPKILQEENDRLKIKNSALQRSITALTIERDGIEDRLKISQKRIEELIPELDKYQNQIASHILDKKRIQNNYEELKRDFEESRDSKDKISENLAKVEEKLKDSKNRNFNLQNDNSSLIDKAKRQESETEMHTKLNSLLKSDLKKLEEENSLLKNDLDAICQEYEDLKSKNLELSLENDLLKVKKQKIEEKANASSEKNREFQRNIPNLEEEIRNLQLKIAKLESGNKVLKKEIKFEKNRYKVLEDELSAKEDQISYLKKTLHSFKNKIPELNESISQLNQEIILLKTENQILKKMEPESEKTIQFQAQNGTIDQNLLIGENSSLKYKILELEEEAKKNEDLINEERKKCQKLKKDNENQLDEIHKEKKRAGELEAAKNASENLLGKLKEEMAQIFEGKDGKEKIDHNSIWIEKYYDRINEISAINAEKKKLKNERDKFQEDMQNLEKAKEKLEIKYSKKMTTHKELKNKTKEMENELIQKTSEKTSMSLNIQNMNEMIDKQVSEIRLFKSDKKQEELIKELRNENYLKQNEIISLKTQYDLLNQRLNQKELEIEELHNKLQDALEKQNNSLKDKTQLESESISQKSQIENLKFDVDLFKKTIEELRSQKAQILIKKPRTEFPEQVVVTVERVKERVVKNGNSYEIIESLEQQTEQWAARYREAKRQEEEATDEAKRKTFSLNALQEANEKLNEKLQSAERKVKQLEDEIKDQETENEQALKARINRMEEKYANQSQKASLAAEKELTKLNHEKMIFSKKITELEIQTRNFIITEKHQIEKVKEIEEEIEKMKKMKKLEEKQKEKDLKKCDKKLEKMDKKLNAKNKEIEKLHEEKNQLLNAIENLKEENEQRLRSLKLKLQQKYFSLEKDLFLNQTQVETTSEQLSSETKDALKNLPVFATDNIVLQANVDRLTEELESAINKLNEKEKNTLSLRNELWDANLKLIKAEKDLTDLSNKLQDLENAQKISDSQIKALEEALAAKNKELKDLFDKINKNNEGSEFYGLNEDLESLKMQLKSSEDEIEDQSKMISLLKDSIEKEKDKAKKDKKKYQKNLTKFQEESEKEKNKAFENEMKLKSLLDKEGIEKQKAIENNNNFIFEKETEINRLQGLLKKPVETVERQITIREPPREDINGLKAQILGLEDLVHHYEDRLSKQNGLLKKTTADNTKFEDDLQEALSKIADLESERDYVLRQLPFLKQKVEEFEQDSAQLSEVKKEIAKLKGEVSLAEDRCALLQSELDMRKKEKVIKVQPRRDSVDVLRLHNQLVAVKQEFNSYKETNIVDNKEEIEELQKRLKSKEQDLANERNQRQRELAHAQESAQNESDRLKNEVRKLNEKNMKLTQNLDTNRIEYTKQIQNLKTGNAQENIDRWLQFDETLTRLLILSRRLLSSEGGENSTMKLESVENLNNAEDCAKMAEVKVSQITKTLKDLEKIIEERQLEQERQKLLASTLEASSIGFMGASPEALRQVLSTTQSLADVFAQISSKDRHANHHQIVSDEPGVYIEILSQYLRDYYEYAEKIRERVRNLEDEKQKADWSEDFKDVEAKLIKSNKLLIQGVKMIGKTELDSLKESLNPPNDKKDERERVRHCLKENLSLEKIILNDIKIWNDEIKRNQKKALKKAKSFEMSVELQILMDNFHGLFVTFAGEGGEMKGIFDRKATLSYTTPEDCYKSMSDSAEKLIIEAKKLIDKKKELINENSNLKKEAQISEIVRNQILSGHKAAKDVSLEISQMAGILKQIEPLMPTRALSDDLTTQASFLVKYIEALKSGVHEMNQTIVAKLKILEEKETAPDNSEQFQEDFYNIAKDAQNILRISREILEVNGTEMDLSDQKSRELSENTRFFNRQTTSNMEAIRTSFEDYKNSSNKFKNEFKDLIALKSSEERKLQDKIHQLQIEIQRKKVEEEAANRSKSSTSRFRTETKITRQNVNFNEEIEDHQGFLKIKAENEELKRNAIRLAELESQNDKLTKKVRSLNMEIDDLQFNLERERRSKGQTSQGSEEVKSLQKRLKTQEEELDQNRDQIRELQRENRKLKFDSERLQGVEIENRRLIQENFNLKSDFEKMRHNESDSDNKTTTYRMKVNQLEEENKFLKRKL